MPRARILAIAFSLLLGLPAVVSVITDHDARSRWENRPLADLPGPVDVLEADRWFAGLERFLEDRLGFAIPLNRIHRRLLLHGFQVSPAEDVTMGKADFLFVTSYRSYPFSILEELCVGSLEPGRARAAGETWTALMEHFSSSHQRVFLLVVPSKPTLYPEQLSSAVPRDYREKCADFRHGASAPGVIARQLS
ncbi:MAG: hypothetical protein KJN94_07290, partial [Gammaproteobacteria bacterium]|nr:hypothetical protein [Gammaproteobacteria bacterium]